MTLFMMIFIFVVPGVVLSLVGLTLKPIFHYLQSEDLQ